MKKTINNNDYYFRNEVWEVRYAWGHSSELYLNSVKIAESSVRYYNRTWESYQFRVVMLQTVEGYISELLDEEIQEYKEANNIKRLTKDKKAIVVSKFEKENAELYELKRSL